MRVSPRDRTWAFVALALGATLSAAALYEGGPVQSGVGELTSGHASQAIFAVANEGTHDLEIAIEITQPDGGGSRVSLAWNAPADETSRRSASGLAADEYQASAFFTWTEGARSARGNRFTFFDPRICDGGESIVVTFHVDTSVGIGIGPDDVRCQ